MKYEYSKVSRMPQRTGMRTAKWLNKMGLKGWEFFGFFAGSKSLKPVYHFRRKLKPATTRPAVQKD